MLLWNWFNVVHCSSVFFRLHNKLRELMYWIGDPGTNGDFLRRLVICLYFCYQVIIPPGLMTLVLEGAGRLQHVRECLHGGLWVDHLHILNTDVSTESPDTPDLTWHESTRHSSDLSRGLGRVVTLARGRATPIDRGRVPATRGAAGKTGSLFPVL